MSALAAVIYLIFEYENLVYAGPTVGAVGLALSVLVLVYQYWSKGRDRGLVESSAPEQVEKAADWLAGAVADSWQKEAVARRLVTPVPIPVRWRWAGDLSRRQAQRLSVPGAGPGPLPGSDRAGRIPGSGVVADLHEELYKRLPRGRLVIVGGPGSGKTSALILLLLKALAWRKELAPEERSRVPVPVLLSLTGWDPASVPLPEWAVGVLNRDYPSLRASRYGNDAASALISSGRVALFLDGLDEMPENLRVAALRRLGTEVPGVRVVLATRPGEYAAATGQAALDNFAVVELDPVQLDAAAKFLLHEQPADKRAAWRKVASYIKLNPGSTAGEALVSPFTLTMARDAYATGDPAALINGSPVSARDKITAQFLARAYSDPRARRWLGSLARHLNGQEGNGPHDLEWWRLSGMLGPVRRILAVALATGAVGAVVGWIIEVPVYLIAPPPGVMVLPSVAGRLITGIIGGLSAGLLVGFLFGLAYAIVLALGKANSEPAQVSLRLRGPWATARGIRRRDYVTRTASGFLGGLATGVGYEIFEVSAGASFLRIRLSGAEELTVIAIMGTLTGLLCGIMFFLISMLEEPWDTRAAATPLSLLAESRSSALRQVVICAPLMAVIIVAGTWMGDTMARGIPHTVPWSLPYAIISGGGIGVIGTVSYVLAFTAWGQWVVLARVVLPLTGRLPWRLTTFLDDAYRRGVLRQAGAVYQFRHLTLQAYLSREPAEGGRIPLY